MPTAFAELCSFVEVNRPHVLSANCRSRTGSACAEETSRVSHKLYRHKNGCTWNNCGDVEKLLCCEESSFLLPLLITIIQTSSLVQTCLHFDRRMLLTISRLSIFLRKPGYLLNDINWPLITYVEASVNAVVKLSLRKQR